MRRGCQYSELYSVCLCCCVVSSRQNSVDVFCCGAAGVCKVLKWISWSITMFNTRWCFTAWQQRTRLYWLCFLHSVTPLLVSSDVSGSVVGGHGGSQGDRGGLGSVLRDLVKPGDENLREMNKKLQNMLEEQLTKNMHLQKVTHTHTHTDEDSLFSL